VTRVLCILTLLAALAGCSTKPDNAVEKPANPAPAPKEPPIIN
jgi:hypothetical protein